jgi:hypothetical protein
MEETAMNDFLEFGRDYYPNERPDIITPLQAGDDPGRRYEADEAALRAIYSPTIADVIVCTHAGLERLRAACAKRGLDPGDGPPPVWSIPIEAFFTMEECWARCDELNATKKATRVLLIEDRPRPVPISRVEFDYRKGKPGGGGPVNFT